MRQGSVENEDASACCKSNPGLRMKFKTLFMSAGDHDLLLFFNMYNQFLAPGPWGLNAECIKVSVM